MHFDSIRSSTSRGQQIDQTLIFWLTSGDTLLRIACRRRMEACATVADEGLPPSGDFESRVRSG
jgi:hypothetical protein